MAAANVSKHEDGVFDGEKDDACRKYVLLTILLVWHWSKLRNL